MPWAKRSAYLLAMAKDAQHRPIAEQLDLFPDSEAELPARWFAVDDDQPSAGNNGSTPQHLETDLLDALGLLDEERRQTQTTVKR